MHAVGLHYGTKVDTWSVWNEPNQPQFLLPQYSPHKTPLSPGIYRKLFIAAQRGLADAGLAGARVLLGETSPRGTGKVVAPLTFLRGALCLDSKYHKTSKSCAKLTPAGYAHHAYTTGQGPTFKPTQPNDVTIGVLSRLTTALDRAAKAGAITSHLPIYLTEFGIESTPDPVRGVSLQRQSEYRAISERIAYDNPRVVAFSQYLLRDDLPKAGVPAIARYPGFETGLFTAAGKHKPSFDGFRLPLAVRRTSSTRVSIWGLVRPAAGVTTATIESRSKGGSFRAADHREDRRSRLLHQERRQRLGARVAPGVEGARRHDLPRDADARLRRVACPADGAAALAPAARRGRAPRRPARRRSPPHRSRARAVARRGARAGGAEGRRSTSPSRARRYARATPLSWPARRSASSRSTTPRCSPASTSPMRWSSSAPPDPDQRVLVVGHEPDFSQVVYDLTGARVDFKKGGIAAVRMDGTRGELIALLRPRELERLGAG